MLMARVPMRTSARLSQSSSRLGKGLPPAPVADWGDRSMLFQLLRVLSIYTAVVAEEAAVEYGLCTSESGFGSIEEASGLSQQV